MKAHTSVFRPEDGFTLLEALVTIVIVSIGLLGLLGLQTVSLVNTQVSASRSEASIAADNIADRMRANPVGVEAGGYRKPVPDDPPTCNAGNKCSGVNMALYDLSEWNQTITQQLGDDASGLVSCAQPGDPDCRSLKITIRWNERDIERARSENRNSAIYAQSFDTVVRP